MECRCGCHRASLASWREAVLYGRGDVAEFYAKTLDTNAPVLVMGDDVMEAAVACPDCLHAHCDSLLERRIWLAPPHAPAPLPVQFATDGDEPPKPPSPDDGAE